MLSSRCVCKGHATVANVIFSLPVQIKPPDEHPYTHVYKWRIQQEHHMKARNGGKGMTDEQVVAYEISSYHPDVLLMLRDIGLWIGTFLDTSSLAMESRKVTTKLPDSARSLHGSATDCACR